MYVYIYVCIFIIYNNGDGDDDDDGDFQICIFAWSCHVLWFLSVLIERFVFEYYSEGSNFFVPSMALSWSDARAHCLSLQADLAVVHDVRMLEFINNIIQKFSLAAIYIGLRRHPKDRSTFRWVDGNDLVYSNWKANEPNSLAEGCILQLSSGWADLHCYYLRRFICQQPIEGEERRSNHLYHENERLRIFIK